MRLVVAEFGQHQHVAPRGQRSQRGDLLSAHAERVQQMLQGVIGVGRGLALHWRRHHDLGPVRVERDPSSHGGQDGENGQIRHALTRHATLPSTVENLSHRAATGSRAATCPA